MQSGEIAETRVEPSTWVFRFDWNDATVVTHHIVSNEPVQEPSRQSSACALTQCKRWQEISSPFSRAATAHAYCLPLPPGMPHAARRSEKAVPERETIMKLIMAGISAISIIASACAFAQTNTGNAAPAHRDTQNAQPGAAGQSMGRAADAGNSKPASGTLMQKREHAMSPQGASNSNATGAMKQ
ncbi:hypothetical protein OKW30_005284 [Paraburkholderia sp. Clong3]|uniref:hypothetical protein n=1 Tax=Paraburkholderia sp. Clong3 TaxID=2991061 RepID=UPI003D22309A